MQLREAQPRPPERYLESLAQQPVRVAAGEATLWARYRILYAKGAAAGGAAAGQQYVLDLFGGRPSGSSPPFRSIAIGQRPGSGPTGGPWSWRDPKSVALYADGRLWSLEWEVGAHDRLTAARCSERRVTAGELLRPDPFRDLPPGDVNGLLVSWKNRELAAILRDASTRDLRAHADRIEHSVLAANEAAEAAKDRAQQLVVKGQPGSEGYAQTARAYRARIEILKAMLRALKAEIANRQR